MITRWLKGFNSLYKGEMVYNKAFCRPFRDVTDVMIATAEYIDWYNNLRIHAEIGNRPPSEYEQLYYARDQTLELVKTK